MNPKSAMTSPLQSTSPYGALLLGAAIRRVFPHVTYLGSGTDTLGFWAEYIDDLEFQHGYLNLILKAMIDLSSCDIQLKEMMGSNARELFKFHGEKRLGEGINGLIEVAEIGDFFDVACGPLVPCPIFSLIGFEQKGRVIRVFGRGFNDKSKQRVFEKKYHKRLKHDQLAHELELYENGFWHARGMLLKFAVENIRRNFLTQHGFLEVSAPDWSSYRKTFGKGCFSIGNWCYHFNPNVLISSLQLLQKWTTMFDCEGSWVLSIGRKRRQNELFEQALKACQIDYIVEESDCSRLELRIIDELGCLRPGPYLEQVDGGIAFVLYESIEAFIAMILEKDKGDLPYWLVPEQVRLLTADSIDIKPVIEIFNYAKVRYTIDRGTAPLKEKMYRALRVKVPYVMVFGKNEESAAQIAVRTHGSKQSEAVSLQQLGEILLEQQVES